jgi:hypothetical protein
MEIEAILMMLGRVKLKFLEEASLGLRLKTQIIEGILQKKF